MIVYKKIKLVNFSFYDVFSLLTLETIAKYQPCKKQRVFLTDTHKCYDDNVNVKKSANFNQNTKPAITTS